MSVIEKANLIIYRLGKKGLEIFLVKSGLEQKDETWTLPQGLMNDPTKANALIEADKAFELDPVQHNEKEVEKALAVEGDWHDIPSLKNLLREDVQFVRDKLIEYLPELEKGTFVSIKDAFKRVMPAQYAFLKELKDIIRERNSIRNL